jgi:hypothetical protein
MGRGGGFSSGGGRSSGGTSSGSRSSGGFGSGGGSRGGIIRSSGSRNRGGGSSTGYSSYNRSSNDSSYYRGSSRGFVDNNGHDIYIRSGILGVFDRIGIVFHNIFYVIGTLLSIILITFAVVVMLLVSGNMFLNIVNQYNYVYNSLKLEDVTRAPLSKSASTESESIRDDAEWVTNRVFLRQGLDSFYYNTGVRPYLWVTKSLDLRVDPISDTTSLMTVDELLEKEYNKLFTDQGHMIVLFYEPSLGEYNIATYVGDDAGKVMDSQTLKLLYNRFDMYYDRNLADDEYFKVVFEKTGEQIAGRLSVFSELDSEIFLYIGIFVLLLFMTSFVISIPVRKLMRFVKNK